MPLWGTMGTKIVGRVLTRPTQGYFLALAIRTRRAVYAEMGDVRATQRFPLYRPWDVAS
jgi:hypothetical protein